MKQKKQMSECERLFVLYEAFENGCKFSTNEVINFFKEYYQVNLTSTDVQKDLKEISKHCELKKTESRPRKYYCQTDEYKDLMDCIESVKLTKDYKTLMFLKQLEKFYKKEIEQYTEILIAELLRFDLSPLDNIHPWASYKLAKSSAKSLNCIIASSPSIIKIMKNKRIYNDAKELLALEMGVSESVFPKTCPYDLLAIIKDNRKHRIFSFADKYLNWRKK